MFKKIKFFLFYWVPPLIWMGIIFHFSSQQRLGVTHIKIIEFMIFKSLHIIEYSILYLLIFRGFFGYKKKFFGKIFLYSALLTLFYSFSDELHQTFVLTRQGAIRDVFIDTIGISLMYYGIKNRIKLLIKIL